MRYVRKPGRLANANERGAGLVTHAVDSEHSVFDMKTPALCGAKPSGRMGWTDYEYMSLTPPPVSCPKCLTAIAKRTIAESTE